MRLVGHFFNTLIEKPALSALRCTFPEQLASSHGQDRVPPILRVPLSTAEQKYNTHVVTA